MVLVAFCYDLTFQRCPMLLTWLAFFFLAFIGKLLLAAAMCYLIFPAERTCDACNSHTLPVRMGVAGRMMSKLMLGTLQKRWCPGCGWEGMTRTGRMRDAHAHVSVEPATR
ncbi:hypothetical protein [Longimicrobium sp.]|uniref:hypothetical protein n=1 Tax=Longimicrobium sp. TaxID=2029185 RepID=UPI003B3B725A